MLVNIRKLKDHVAEWGYDKLPSFNDISTKDDDKESFSFKDILMSATVREDYMNRVGFSILTTELIDEIKTIVGDNPVMELGSGTGYLAKHLEDAGVNIYTVDTDDWGFETSYRKTDLISSYRQLDVSNYNMFIMSWPNYNSPPHRR
jgi:2-polyprenyl-3-methyl-5-hydroxy-6-metoxy-1,4-benzoquinol methylase